MFTVACSFTLLVNLQRAVSSSSEELRLSRSISSVRTSQVYFGIPQQGDNSGTAKGRYEHLFEIT